MLQRSALTFVLIGSFLVQHCTASDYKILGEANHDTHIFTQGFDYEPPYFYISSGLYQKSFLVREHDGTGARKGVKLPTNIFAEGLVKVGNSIYLLTWKAGYRVSNQR